MGVRFISSGERVTVVVPNEAADGRVSFVEQHMPARHLIGCHVHERHDVWIYVISGQVGVRVGDEEAVGEAGDYLLKPRAVRHAMWNPGDEPNHLVEVLTPGDGDLFFRAMAGLPDDASREAFEALAATHGVIFFDDWNEDLKQRHGLL